ncbi:MAG: SLBB domain-containing protein [Deltaproteobacteria bacterium]|nr:SLBB domain-containing protein [Deltaproteobacteria bacterium]
MMDYLLRSVQTSFSQRGRVSLGVLLVLLIFSPFRVHAQDPRDLLMGIQALQGKDKNTLGEEGSSGAGSAESDEKTRLSEIQKIEGEPLSKIERFFIGEEGLRWLQIEKGLEKKRLGLDEKVKSPETIKSPEEKDVVREIVQKRLEGQPLSDNLLNLQIKEVELRKGLRQFGYDLFRQKRSTFTPESESPVGPDYIIGPGDELTVTLWGIVEGIFQLKVSPEGEVTLPKVGVVSVAGIRYGELESYLKEQLSRYYKDFNIRVTLQDIHRIQIYVVGEVQKPGRHSVSSLSTAFHALFIAGGPTKDGSLRSIQVKRNGQVIQQIDLYDLILKGDARQDIRLQNGDTVFVPLIQRVVAIAGEVYRPAIYEVKEDAILNELMEMAGGGLASSSNARIQIERFEGNERKTVQDVRMNGEMATTRLSDLDLVKVYPIYPKVWGKVSLEGTIRYPGEYAYSTGMRISDLLTADQILPETFMGRAEIIRLSEDSLKAEVIQFNPAEIMAHLDPEKDWLLEPQDRLSFYSYVRKPGTIEIAGEVLLPGRYFFEEGERLSSLLKRAGGFTDKAFLEGAIFTRQTIAKAQESQRKVFMQTQQQQLLKESASIAASGLGEDAQSSVYELQQRQQLLQLQSERVEEGRMVIRLRSLELFQGSAQDILLEDGDRLYISQIPAYVAIIGEVRNPSTFLYRSQEDVRYYLAQAGGFTSNAEEKGAYLLRADGTAALLDSRAEIRPGDSIIIPTKIEVKYRPLPFWRDIVGIVGGVATTITSIVVLAVSL